MSYSGALTEQEMEAGRAHTADLLARITKLVSDSETAEGEAIAELVGDDLATHEAYWQRRYAIERNFSTMIDGRASLAMNRADRAETALRPYVDVFEAVFEYLLNANPDPTDLSLLRSRVAAAEEAM